jgi:MSHA pilin protein MshC
MDIEMLGKEHGFTLIEIVVVLILISIIAAAVFTRSITTDELNLISRAEKVQNHIRYAQSMALKTNEVWGISADATHYWLFNGYKAADVDTGVNLPGEDADKITLNGSGVSLNSFLLYFDHIGRPYKILDYDNPASDQPVTTASPLTITVTSEEDASIIRQFSITPETGLIVVTQ